MNSNHREIDGTLYLRTDDPEGFVIDGLTYLAAEKDKRPSNLDITRITFHCQSETVHCDFLTGGDRLWSRLLAQSTVDFLDLPGIYRED